MFNFWKEIQNFLSWLNTKRLKTNFLICHIVVEGVLLANGIFLYFEGTIHVEDKPSPTRHVMPTNNDTWKFLEKLKFNL